MSGPTITRETEFPPPPPPRIWRRLQAWLKKKTSQLRAWAWERWRDLVLLWREQKPNRKAVLVGGIVAIAVWKFSDGNMSAVWVWLEFWWAYTIFVRVIREKEYTFRINIRVPRALTYFLVLLGFVLASDQLVNAVTGWHLWQLASDPAALQQLFEQLAQARQTTP